MAHLKSNPNTSIKWPTVAVGVLCYSCFVVSTAFSEPFGAVAATALLTLTLTLYSSFNHEVLHGHPFPNKTANTALVFPALGILIPYPRFRDTHLAHHHDPSLTDPYDDPETNFVDPTIWAGWSRMRRTIYQWNNTLLGRMAIGPLIGLWTFYVGDARAIASGDRQVRNGWIFHTAALIPLALWLWLVSDLPLWLYALAVYLSHSILKIRTFLEHRAHEKARCRSVIIEDRGPLSFLFLNNNLHAVHHACPTLPWYELQVRYAADRARYLTRNGGYAYRSYAQVARLFLLTAKDPVPHTLWPSPQLRKENTIPGPQ